MSRATEIYDRMVKMKMQKALDAERYNAQLEQQRIVSESGIVRNRDQQRALTKRQAGLNEVNLKKAYIDDRYKTNKAQQDYNYNNRKLTSDENIDTRNFNQNKFLSNRDFQYTLNKDNRDFDYTSGKDNRDFNYTLDKDNRDFNKISAKETEDLKNTEREFQYKKLMDEEAKKQKRDEDLISEGQHISDQYAEFIKTNPKVYPMKEGKGKDKKYYLINSRGEREYMAEQQAMSHLANNDKIDVMMRSLANGYNVILDKRGLIKKASEMTPAQIKSLKERKARSPKWKIDTTKGLITKDEGLTMGELASKWANRLTNDKLPIGSYPSDKPTMPRFANELGQRQMGSVDKTINPDLLSSPKPDTGTSFRGSVGDSSKPRIQR